MPINTFVKGTVILSAAVNQNFVLVQTQDVWNEDLTGQISVGNLVFNIARPYVINSTRIFVDGVRQKLGLNYTESGSQTVSFLAGQNPQSGQDVLIDYRQIL